MDQETVEYAKRVAAAVSGRNNLIHAVFQYQCESCHSIELIGMGYGVEGPKELYESQASIPSPFMCMCQTCGGTQKHINFHQDVRFTPRPPHFGGRYFCVPKDGPDIERLNTSMFAGDLIGTPRYLVRF